MRLKKIIFLTAIILVILISVTGFVIKNRIQTQVKELFKMNKELQEENYYMAEFEFKMLGMSYYLGKGQYFKAISTVNRVHRQMKKREGLIKIPEFNTKEQELEFYLNLQNPKTGAFMDDSFPLNTQHEPTENVLLLLDKLVKETGQPLKLKYPLKYLDEFNTPEKLIPILNDWSTMNRLAVKFPTTSFHNVRDLSALARDSSNYDEDKVDMVIYKHNLYHFSPEWKRELLKWLYDHQDAKSGCWGPRSKNGKLLRKDVSNTAPILKAFLDEDGNNIHSEFPFRYGNELFATILTELDKDIPEDDELDKWHEWGLETPKGIRTLTRYLWKNASEENKEKAKILIEDYIKILFQKFYIPEEGAFSYYPDGEHATLDGARSGLKIFREIGAISGKKQKELWGIPEKNITDAGNKEVAQITLNDLEMIAKQGNSNSLRVYTSLIDFSDLTAGVSMIIYQLDPEVLDVMDLTYKIKKWALSTPLTMGNWVSKEEIIHEFDSIQYKEVPASIKDNAIENINLKFKENGKLTVIGFDLLQIPRYKIVYEHL
ncbi:MAG: hypothetical protein QG611_1046 [Bacteroidota bacterium]|nr:hypothetical protein [Bacteroidota bacterium]